MPSATLTRKGRVTVPRGIRRALGLEKGARAAFRVREHGVVEMVPERTELLGLRGILKPKRRGVTLEHMAQAIAEGALER